MNLFITLLFILDLFNEPTGFKFFRTQIRPCLHVGNPTDKSWHFPVVAKPTASYGATYWICFRLPVRK